MVESMSLENALHQPLSDIATDQLWPACIVIGEHKLELRQEKNWTKHVDVFTPMNRRIDDLQNEEERRRSRNR